jgi:hypothetical protein
MDGQANLLVRRYKFCINFSIFIVRTIIHLNNKIVKISIDLIYNGRISEMPPNQMN